jgi:hypothetical protein
MTTALASTDKTIDVERREHALREAMPEGEFDRLAPGIQRLLRRAHTVYKEAMTEEDESLRTNKIRAEQATLRHELEGLLFGRVQDLSAEQRNQLRDLMLAVWNATGAERVN